MAKINKFTDLEVWKKAHELTLQVYLYSKSFPKEEMFGLLSQIRRAVVSVESNIAEGFSRYHYKDRVKFYFQARGSLSEVQSQLITTKDLGYINQEDFNKMFELSEKVAIILSGLIRSTQIYSKNP